MERTNDRSADLRSVDAELRTLRKLTREMESLSPTARKRALSYLTSRFGNDQVETSTWPKAVFTKDEETPL